MTGPRIAWVDHLRIVAAFLVVVVHASAVMFYGSDPKTEVVWWFANFINVASRCAVPLFVMITGYLLLGRKSEAIPFCKRRYRRIIPALLVWNLIFLVFNYHIYGVPEEVAQGGWLNIVVDLSLLTLMLGSSAVHLWYLTMLVCLIPFIPLFNKLILGERLTLRDGYFYFFVFLVFALFNSVSGVLKEVNGIDLGWHKTFVWFIVYLLAGYFIGHYSPKLKMKLGIYSSLALVLLVIVMGVCLNYWLFALKSVAKDWIIMSNEGVLTFALSLLVFYIFVCLKAKLPASEFLGKVADASFGVYLLHPIILKLLEQGLSPLQLNKFVYLILLISICFIFSLLVVIALRKVALVRRIT